MTDPRQMTTLDGASRTFQRALEEARRSDRTANPDIESGYVPKPRVRTPVEFVPAQGGGEARWGLAMTWANEPEVMTSTPAADQTCQPARLDTDIAEAIAQELGVSVDLTEGQLTHRWRAFVWRNHPDRQPIHARERANIRVAIANTLYHQARRNVKRAR